MSFKKVCDELNVVKSCRQYGLTLWQCPNFLFLVLGFIVIFTILITYYIANLYMPDPRIAALIVMVVSAILMIIGNMIVQSFNRLAKANQSKSEFISIASHQLRSPITNIKWMLSILMKSNGKEIDSEQLEQMRAIKENNDRMNTLVNDLLIAARVDQGRLILKSEEMDLKALVEQLIKEYQPYAQANHIALHLQSDQDLLKVFADRTQIKIAVQRLLENGIKYIKGIGSVKIRLINKKKSVRCEVEDTGVGIPKQEQKKVFQKFFRSQNIMRYQTQGSGLGLFIAKSIIQNSRGKIGFSSQENKGSIFWVELPVKL